MMLSFRCEIRHRDPGRHERGASEVGSSGLSADTERALQVMEACQAGAAEGVKGHAEKLLNIFQSDLFQALLGECYHGNATPQLGVRARTREQLSR